MSTPPKGPLSPPVRTPKPLESLGGLTNLFSFKPVVESQRYRWAYIVSFDLNAWDSFNYMPFFQDLHGSLDWWHFLNFTYIVVRHETLVELGVALRDKLHSKDRLLILPAKGPGDGWLPAEAWEWIKIHLQREW